MSALIALSACEREGDVDIDAVEEVVADAGGQHAYIVNPDEISMGLVIGAETRTDFDSYAGKFAWSEGDKIAIHLSDGTFYETEVNAETCVFTCSTTESKQRDGYAIYPASARDASNYGSPTLKIILPEEYDIRDNLAGGYSPVPMIAVNSQAEDDLYFRHVGSLLRLTCNRVPKNTQTIQVTFDQRVAGAFTVVNPESENPTISDGGNAYSVRFRVATDVLEQRTDGIVLNIPIPVGVVTKMTVTALDNYRHKLEVSERDLPSIPRGHGKKLIYNVTPAFTDSMQMIVTASEDNSMTFMLPFGGFCTLPADLLVDWGDGTSDFFIDGSYFNLYENKDVFTHTYQTEGDYTITLTAVADRQDDYFLPGFSFYNISDIDSRKKKMLKAVLTPVLRGVGIGGVFKGCANLESICPGIFSKNRNMDCSYAFCGCKSLHDIPEDLFINSPAATSFAYTFAGAGLTCNIPENMFARHPRITSFAYTFSGCPLTGSIPEGLFANNPLVKSFSHTFDGCNQLSGSIPSGLFASCPLAEDFTEVFRFCSNLTGSIPGSLFANNPLAKKFEYAFYGCSKLSGIIPGNLFAHQPDITSFASTFRSCDGITGVSSDLFANQLHVTSFDGTFEGCKGLTSIPSDLFAHNMEVTSFYSTFDGSGLRSIPPGLFANHSAVTTFERTFYWCTSMNSPIPGDLFSGCTGVTSFSGTFQSCKFLRGPIPESLFADCPAVTSFAGVFSDCCVNDYGPIPEDLFANNTEVVYFSSAFRGSYYLRDLPAGLFSRNTKAKDFFDCFGQCTSLRGEIPAGFFANNTEATGFESVFAGCTGLKLSHDIFINGTTQTPANRFASLEARANFKSCFSGTGSSLSDGGTAPALWDYTFPDAYLPISTACFRGCTTLSNWGAVDDAWK